MNNYSKGPKITNKKPDPNYIPPVSVKAENSEKKLRRTLILSVFPYSCEEDSIKLIENEFNIKILDLREKSPFKYIEVPDDYDSHTGGVIYKKEENTEYPQNFIDVINSNSPKFDIILIPFDQELRQKLRKEGYNVFSYIPSLSEQERYVGRAFIRNVTEQEISTQELYDNWYKWMQELKGEYNNKNQLIITDANNLYDWFHKYIFVCI